MESDMIAFDLIGYDGDQYIRIVGGRSLYETVSVADGYEGHENVRLVRIIADGYGIRQINRYVSPDTPVELVSDTPSPNVGRVADYQPAVS
jgi:hypothetical protein